MADLTPSERGALRHARAQLDQFERAPEARYAESAVRAAAALLTAACEGDRGRRADAEAAASAALDELDEARVCGSCGSVVAYGGHNDDCPVDDDVEARDRAQALNYLRHEPCYRVELNRRYGPTPRVSFVEATSEEDATALLRVGNDWERTHLVQPSPPLRVVSVRRATVADVDEFLAES